MTAPQIILDEIRKLAKGRKVNVLAVSKLQSIDKIKNLYDLGHRQFAENYVQEVMDKQKLLLNLEIEWHFIGSLQKNKVKFVVGSFELIHSVDSFELAQKIAKKAVELGLRQKILLQVNLALEETKGGFSEAELRQHIQEIQSLEGLQIEGLMTMPPLTDDSENARPYFKKLRELAQEYGMRELSMGTSSDYRVAIEEGATLIRLGTVLFGARN